MVLVDYGWFDINSFTFTQTLRVKILKKAGYDLADFKYDTDERPLVRGMVYNLEGDKVVKEKLPASAFYYKKLGTDSWETSFSIPNVKEGTVFDIQYTCQGLPYEWLFQRTIPVKYSELVIPQSPYLNFSKNFFGYTPLAVSNGDRWVATDVPAFREEPYINSRENYMTKMEIEIRSISIPGFVRSYSTTWEDVNNNLLMNTYFPAQSQALLCTSSLLDELKSSGKSGDELIKAAFEAVKKEAWNEEFTKYISDEGLCSHFKSGSGSVADINFMLLQILNKLGFEVYPVVLSSRGNGMLSQFSPSRYKLNYVIVALKNENGFTLLDATEKYMPYNLLPDRVINGNGRIVSDKYSQWIPLVCKSKESSVYKYDMKLNDDLTLTGKMEMTLSDYAAYDFREMFSKYNSKEELAKAFEKMNPGLTVNEITVENAQDLYKPVIVTLDASIEGLVTQVDNELYITPMLFEQVKNNPFNAPERVYPISYSRFEDTRVNVNITLPDNITPGVLPKPMSSKVRNNAVAFTYNVTAEGQLIKADYVFDINALTITQDLYKDVRSVYTNLVSKHAEPVILKMK